MKNIEISLSKTKMFLMLFGCIVFVIAGICFMTNPAKYVSVIFRNSTFIFIAGLVSILFFGFIAYHITKKIFQTNIGLIINDEGIIDNSGGSSLGMIYWKDIEAIDAFKVVHQKFIRIIVKNPNDYIERQTNLTKRKVAMANYKAYKSPIQISANTLKIKFDELYKLLQNKFDNIPPPSVASF